MRQIAETSISVGLHVHAQPASAENYRHPFGAHCAAHRFLLLDGETRPALQDLSSIEQPSTEQALGVAVCFNRLVPRSATDFYVLLESGTVEHHSASNNHNSSSYLKNHGEATGAACKWPRSFRIRSSRSTIIGFWNTENPLSPSIFFDQLRRQYAK